MSGYKSEHKTQEFLGFMSFSAASRFLRLREVGFSAPENSP